MYKRHPSRPLYKYRDEPPEAVHPEQHQSASAAKAVTVSSAGTAGASGLPVANARPSSSQSVLAPLGPVPVGARRRLYKYTWYLCLVLCTQAVLLTSTTSGVVCGAANADAGTQYLCQRACTSVSWAVRGPSFRIVSCTGYARKRQGSPHFFSCSGCWRRGMGG
jgi:hypothetical protein